jgi:hypothetical protein
VKRKKCSEVCEAGNWQINCRELIFTLFSGFPPTPHCHPTPHLDVGKYAAAVIDEIHIQWLFLGLWPVLRHKTGRN